MEEDGAEEWRDTLWPRVRGEVGRVSERWTAVVVVAGDGTTRPKTSEIRLPAATACTAATAAGDQAPSDHVFLS